VGHVLCPSSEPTLASVPKGTKELASRDVFEHAPQTNGWACLRFELSDPTYYQYKYTKGSGYLGPARGLPDPGPDGFEASAVGDLDGNGKTSLFTMVGVVNKETKAVLLSTDVYCSDPGE
jgi:type IV pilus assembly protein PilA